MCRVLHGGRREGVREHYSGSCRDGCKRTRKRTNVVLVPMAIEGQTMGRGSDYEENVRGNTDEGERQRVMGA